MAEDAYQVQVDLDRHGNIPLYQQIVSPLEQAIMSGDLAPNRLVEDEVSMAKRLEVSRPTARRALQELVTRGLLSRKRGVGTRVTPPQIHRPLELTSLNDDLIKAGFKPTTRVITYEIAEAEPQTAQELGIEVGQGVVHCVRLRSIDDQPLAVLTNLLPLDLAPGWSELQEKGLYQCFSDRGVRISVADQVIGARSATAEEAQLLEEEAKSPLLTMSRTAYTVEGRIVEVGQHVYRPSLHSFRFKLFAQVPQ